MYSTTSIKFSNSNQKLHVHIFYSRRWLKYHQPTLWAPTHEPFTLGLTHTVQNSSLQTNGGAQVHVWTWGTRYSETCSAVFGTVLNSKSVDFFASGGKISFILLVEFGRKHINASFYRFNFGSSNSEHHFTETSFFLSDFSPAAPFILLGHHFCSESSLIFFSKSFILLEHHFTGYVL